jgi:DNA-binding beta-propeller fold protein YncE
VWNFGWPSAVHPGSAKSGEAFVSVPVELSWASGVTKGEERRNMVGKAARLGLGALALALVGAAGCGGAGNSLGGTSSVAPKAAAASTCAPMRGVTGALSPIGGARAGSTVALGTWGNQTIAYAADEDDWAIHVIDVDRGKELGAAALEGRPSQLMLLPDGRLVVLLRDKSQAAVMQPIGTPAALSTRCTVDTSDEPVGLALTPDNATVLVTSGWGRTLASFDAERMVKRFEVALGREPRAVVVSDDGNFAFVSHAVGAKASRVELTAPAHAVVDVPLGTRDLQREQRLRSLKDSAAMFQKNGAAVPQSITDAMKSAEEREPSCQGFALAKSVEIGNRILAPQVLVETGDPAQRAPGYGNDNVATEVPDVAVIDATTARPIPVSLERPIDRFGWGGISARDLEKPECLLPRAAAIDPKGKSLLVSCFGIDEVIAYDALAASPARAERKRWYVGAGPNGIAIDPGKNRAVVWSQFDHALNVIDLGNGELADDNGKPLLPVPRIEVAKGPTRRITDSVALGRSLFHAVGDTRISKDGRACASCHPDGRDDSLVWATPEGPRRSIMLAGRLASTAPYAWAGNEKSLREHLAITFDRLNGAGGLKSMELDALVAYVNSLPTPPVRPAHDAKALRGAELFASAEVGCTDCHTGAVSTDNGRHDVKSKATADKSTRFNTPTLHFVGGTGPYFHDGRYKTLHDLLTSNGDNMGHTKQLSHDDLDALEAYLRTL